MKKNKKKQAPTYESVLALIEKQAQHLEKQAQQIEKEALEREKAQARFEQEMERSRAEFDSRMAEADKRREEFRSDYERRMKVQEKLNGSWANNLGAFAEEYFYNSFLYGKQNFFNEKFDLLAKKVTHFWQGIRDEYDIVLYNHTSVALIEVKYKAHKNDVIEVLKKPETFRFLFPNYKDFKIYLGFASLSFYPEMEEACKNQGIAIIKQVGDTVVVNDEHLKVY
jgi:hypothetical protein